MDLQNFALRRIVFHEVHRRLDDRRPQNPTYGQQLGVLNPEALEVFRARIVAAIGHQSQSMDMTIVRLDAESAVAIAQALLTAPDDAAFIATSRRVADKLTEAQTSRGVPGGVVAIFEARAGVPATPIAGYIKAELHGGFRRGNNLQIEYLKSLFMTPQTKLYKIGLFRADDPASDAALPDGWSARVYDNQMSAANRDGAARYFFESFLGLELPQSGARMTRKFWEGTKDFIRAAPVAEEAKSDLLTGLYSYLRVDQGPTVEVAAFANTYLEPDLRDDYHAYMNAEGFPLNAVPKDLSELKGKLRKRRVSFDRDIQLTAPPEAFAELINVEIIDAGEAGGEEGQVWTRITVKDRIRDQE